VALEARTDRAAEKQLACWLPLLTPALLLDEGADRSRGWGRWLL